MVGEIPQLRHMLESAGIACLLRNEMSAGLSPEVPIPDSTPELWIQDDDRLAEALQIKADFQSSATVVGQDWQFQKAPFPRFRSLESELRLKSTKDRRKAHRLAPAIDRIKHRLVYGL